MKNRIDFTDSVLAARNGEVQAFEFLYNQSVQFFKAKLIPYSRNEQDAEDLLQECYIKIFSSLDQLKEPKAFLGWGAQICVRKGIDAVRARNKKEEHLKEEFHPMVSEEDVQGMDAMSAAQYREQADPQEKLDAEETRRLLNEMIGDLPEMQKVCILLWQDNYSTAEIAETLDIPAGTVKSNITYAKKKIREKVLLLEKQGTRLYSLAPLPFFLWVMRLYTQEYLAAKPALASAASFRNILGNLPDGLIHAASNAAANAIPQAAQPLSSSAAQVQTGTFVQTASQTPSGLSGASTGTAGSGSGATSAATGSKMGHAAASSTAKAVGGAATKTVVTKVIISIVCVVIIGFGGYQAYHFLTDLFNEEKVQEHVVQEVVQEPKSEEPESEPEPDEPDWDAINQNAFGLTLEDVSGTQLAPLNTDLRKLDVALVAKNEDDDLWLYECNVYKNGTVWSSENNQPHRVMVIRKGNVFSVENINFYVGDVLYDYGTLTLADLDNDQEDEVVYIQHDRKSACYEDDAPYKTDVLYSGLQYGGIYNGSDDGWLDKSNSINNNGGTKTTLIPVMGYVKVIECQGLLNQSNNMMSISSYSANDISLDLYNSYTNFTEITDSIISFEICEQPFTVNYTNKQVEDYVYEKAELGWSSGLTEQFGAWDFYLEEDKLMIEFPFAISRYFNYDLASTYTYLGKGYAEISYHDQFDPWSYNILSVKDY